MLMEHQWISAITKFVVITVFATNDNIDNYIFGKIIILRCTRVRACSNDSKHKLTRIKHC